jgi:hypothetical protein
MAFNPSSLPCCTGRGPFGRLHHRTMKLVMTLLARDEEDILASNLDFHVAHGVDFFIATDNLSVDRTSEILRSYEHPRKNRHRPLGAAGNSCVRSPEAFFSNRPVLLH